MERFLRRRPISMLPNSIRREINHRGFIAARHKRQEKLVTQKGRDSREKFEIGDEVVIQILQQGNGP